MAAHVVLLLSSKPSHPAHHAPPTPTTTTTPRLQAQGECAVALSWLLIVPGTALPIAAQALAECRLFARHQQQRARAGLPAEWGWNARFYGVLQDVIGALSGVQALAACWIGLGILADIAQLSSA